MPLFGGSKESASDLFDKGGKELTSGNLKEAIRYYDKAIKADPNMARAWLNKGVCIFESGYEQEANAFFNKAMHIDITTKSELKTFFSLRASNFQKSGKLCEALHYSQKALEVDIDDPNLWLQKGNIQWKAKKQEEALVSFKKCAELAPGDASMVAATGSMLLSAGRYEEAITYLDKATEIDPQSSRIWHGKGLCLNALGKLDESLTCINNALKNNPNDDESWYVKSILMINLHRSKEEIMNCIKQSLECNPQCIIENFNDFGLPEGFPLSPHEWIEELMRLNQIIAIQLAHTYYDLCIDNPVSGLEAIETLLKEKPELESNSIIQYTKSMAYIAKGLKKLWEKIQTGEVNLPSTKPEEIQPYLTEEDLKYLDLALNEIRKIEDIHPEFSHFIENTKRAGTLLDAVGYTLEKLIPGRIQTIFGKTKLKYFGKERIKTMHSVNQTEIKPLLDVFFKFHSIVKSALVMSQGNTAGKESITCTLFKKTFDILGPEDTLEKVEWAGMITLCDDGTFHE